MDSSVYLQLPFPPTINSYYLRGKILSSRGRIFKDAVQAECYEQNAHNLLIDTQVDMSVILYCPDQRVRDQDNYIKPLQDALTLAGVWTDDRLVYYHQVFRGVVIKGGSCKVRIAPFEGMILPFTDEVWDYVE